MSETQTEQPVDPGDIRWKMAVACDVCRRRKVRCDGERPCSRCKKGNRECTFSLPRHIARKTQDPGSRSTPSPTEDAPPPKRPSLRASSSRRASQSSQIVYSGPSSGMPLFARLGLLRTVEVSESEQHGNEFSSHSSSAFGITSAVSASRDYFDMCLQRCPQELMNSLIGHHLSTPVFFPLLHAPSFLSEFIAVTERRLKCTPQYGAMLMSILAVTARLVEGGRGLVPAADRAGEAYYEFAQDLLRVSKNKLDIRHILALYHLALFAEGRNASTGVASSFVAEAIGLAYATGLHRSTDDFRMDPVTMQIRTRLFWALYSLDVALAYSQGRPALIRLSESINAPFITISQRFSLGDPPRRRSEKLARAQICLDEIEQSLPPYLVRSSLPSDTSLNLIFLQSSRLRSTLLFVRTLIARQSLIDEFERSPGPSADPSESTLVACHLSVDIVKTYSRLRHFGFLQYCNFTAVSHLTAASHTLIACMLRSPNLAFEHRPDLLSAIDMLILFSSRFPCAKTVAQLLVQLSRTLDFSSGDTSGTSSEALAIRVLARKMAVSPGDVQAMAKDRELPPSPLRSQTTPEQYDYDWLVRAATGGTPAASFSNDRSLPPLSEAVGEVNGFKQGTPRNVPNVELPWDGPVAEELLPDWGDNFSFLNDGLFGSL
ncbi:uncharacterized protein L199_002224 [Kwoniella botswanensis]|uniref:uncharacterized protein n=1 Tax=Kwoniella botswanensis TaxID=1268659 RepID=UPI00315CC7E1